MIPLLINQSNVMYNYIGQYEYVICRKFFRQCMTHSKQIHEKQYSNFTESNKQHNILIGHIKSNIVKNNVKTFFLGKSKLLTTVNCALSLSLSLSLSAEYTLIMDI
jgi:hypothetical protein